MIYEALCWIDDWPGKKKGKENNTALYSIYGLTDTFAERKRLTVPGAQ